ncbi:polysaccharide lyase [Pseudonocardia kujensis]|uniref:polysaccharide lyase n=1 Tax=Pseudonocardia kujensis TaxID=1128675 RepID=UPI001E3612DC|nr:polysaccharide lyase [Pseudonocardia kujensis]MCE0763121.1 polysaccharide lyase [Pseudonocardia kujensis]
MRAGRGGRAAAWAAAAFALVFAGCAAPSSSAAEGVSSELLWAGDLETGDLSQFQDGPWNLVGGVPPKIVEDPVRSGRYAVALTLDRTTTSADGICCGSRNELLPKVPDLREGDERWFAFSTYLEPGFPVDAYWQVLTQFKQDGDGPPPLGLYVEEGQYRIEGGGGHPWSPDPFDTPIGAATTGEWVDWTIHVVFSSNPDTGSVEVWKNGALALPRFAPPAGTMYPKMFGTADSYVKTGYYRSPDIATPGTLVLDDWRIGTTRESVDRSPS